MSGVGNATVTTEIGVVGVECSWCFNDTLHVLRREPGVLAVVPSGSGHRVLVEHRSVAVDRLIAVVMGRPSAGVASAPEHLTIAVDPRAAASRCTHRRTSDRGPT